jgi:hypothetical protein
MSPTNMDKLNYLLKIMLTHKINDLLNYLINEK